MNLQGPKSRVSGSTVIATFALVAALLWAPGRAAAHGDDGSMDVQSSAQTGPNMLRLEVSIPYPDGDLADNATVTATLNGPRGTVIPTSPYRGQSAAMPLTSPSPDPAHGGSRSDLEPHRRSDDRGQHHRGRYGRTDELAGGHISDQSQTSQGPRPRTTRRIRGRCPRRRTRPSPSTPTSLRGMRGPNHRSAQAPHSTYLAGSS